MSIYRRARMLLPATAIAVLAACQPRTVTMTPEEAQRVAQLTERMTPRCVGRYLIDLPVSFMLNNQWSAVIDGVKVDVRPMTKTMFDVSLATYRNRLEKTKLPLNGFPSLRSVTSAEDAIVFDKAFRDTSTDRASRLLERWGWKAGYKINATIEAFDGSFPEDANDSIAKQMRTNISDKSSILMSVYQRLGGRTETEIPMRPGFCIANGFLAGPPSENEESYVSFELAGSPDVWLNVASIPETAKEDTRLLERTAQVERDMMASGTQTIRKGAVKFGGAPFDEWLFKGRTPDRVPGTMFYLLGNESTPGLAHPFIRMQLFNGFRVPAPERTAEQSAQLQDLERASLSEAEAIGVWNKVAATVRLRPGAF
jgi:hypothetical protein